MTTKHDSPSDDEYDALNDETFGGEDEWEWGDEAGELSHPGHSSLTRNSVPATRSSQAMHSSNLTTSMTSMPNVSGIRRLSELEGSFSSTSLREEAADVLDDPAIMKLTKSPHQPLMSSLIQDRSTSSDPFSSFSMNRSLLSSSVWTPPDQSLFDTTSVPCSLSSNSPVPPAPPSDPWNTFPLSAPPDNNNSIVKSSSMGTDSLKEGSVISAPAGAAPTAASVLKMIQQAKTLEELEASFRTMEFPPKQQQLLHPETASPKHTPNIGLQPLDRVAGPPLQAMNLADAQQLDRRMQQQQQPDFRDIRLMHPVQMMAQVPVLMPHQIGMHYPMPRLPPPPGHRMNLIHHPQIQQNFLLFQPTPYRPPHQMPPHPFLNQQQQQQQNQQHMYNMQMQQRLPYHRVNYVNNSNMNMNMNRMPNQSLESASRQPVDEYAGFMNLKEREWLIRIQKLQLESAVTDPYVEDYYAMCYNSKKLAEAKMRESQAAPTLVVVESRVAREAASSSKENRSDNSGNQRNSGSNYVPMQFENSLGKIQVSNIQCPRKLLDLMSLSEKGAQSASDQTISPACKPESTKPLARKELTKFRKLLLDIERLYLILLKIDYEDKRMAGLPEDKRQPHVEVREQLCRQLFEGITRRPDPAAGGDVSTARLNVQIASIRKGCALIFRSLQLLHDVNQKEVIIADLLNEENFHLIANQKDKKLYSLDYLQILFDCMKSINPKLTDEELTSVSFE